MSFSATSTAPWRPVQDSVQLPLLIFSGWSLERQLSGDRRALIEEPARRHCGDAQDAT
jgi:hypothetical protein